jgi:NAD(P)H-binding
MQITIPGVSRPIGAHAAEKALDHGHVVFVLVRRGVASIPNSVIQHENAKQNLNVIDGDATDVGKLKEVTAGSDAVLSFLGSNGKLKTTVMSDSTKVLYPIELFANQKLIDILPRTIKIVIISNIGIGESRQYQNCLLRKILIDWIMGSICKDKYAAETALAGSRITEWAALRAGRLMDWPEKVDKVKFVDLEKAKISSKVSRQDVAAVALKLVEDGYGELYWGTEISLQSGKG